jgi:hypothetical protein
VRAFITAAGAAIAPASPQPLIPRVGQALYEGAVYDADGQLVTASFMDYRMPRAEDFPRRSSG